MLKWPDRAWRGLVKLFEPLQDIDIYVEDSRDETFYTELLKRVANGEVRIARVFAPPKGEGGRSTVLDVARAHDHTQRRALFLIDGDLPFTRGEPLPESVRNLYRLEAYCIENFLICREAAVRVLMEEAVLTREAAEARFNFEAWVETIKNPLINLFSCFGLLNATVPSYATVSAGVGIYCHQVGKQTQLSPEKVERAIEQMRTIAAEALAGEVFDERMRQIRDRAHNLSNPLLVVSGKDFLLPLLMFRLQSLGCQLRADRFRYRLALHCEIAKLSELLREMKKVAKGG